MSGLSWAFTDDHGGWSPVDKTFGDHLNKHLSRGTGINIYLNFPDDMGKSLNKPTHSIESRLSNGMGGIRLWIQTNLVTKKRRLLKPLANREKQLTREELLEQLKDVRDIPILWKTCKDCFVF